MGIGSIGARLPPQRLIQPAGGDLILVPAEIMAQLVQIRQPDLVAEDFDVVFGEIPTFATIVGGALIIGAALIASRR